MSCDLHKAYDSVSWKYLKEVLKQSGFGDNFQKWVNILYCSEQGQTPTARVQVNRFLSEPYSIKRGLRQGCRLSCYLFLLCIEPLLIKIRKDKRVSGINVQNIEIKTTAYADDLTIFMDGSETSLRSCMDIFDEFQKTSGLTHIRQKAKSCG